MDEVVKRFILHEVEGLSPGALSLKVYLWLKDKKTQVWI